MDPTPIPANAPPVVPIPPVEAPRPQTALERITLRGLVPQMVDVPYREDIETKPITRVPTIPTLEAIRDYGTGIFSAELDEGGQAAARKKAVETGAILSIGKFFGKTVTGVGEGLPLISRPAAHEIGPAGSELPHLDAQLKTAGEREAERLALVEDKFQQGELRRRGFALAGLATEGAAGALTELLPDVVEPKPITPQNPQPTLPELVARGTILAASIGQNNGVAIVRFREGGSSGTVGVKLPATDGTFDPRRLRGTTALALASAEAAEGIRKELPSETADP